MRRTILLRAGIVAVLVAGVRFDAAEGIRLTGAAPVEAKDYYTKKRVNGRWVTGRFPKRSAGRPSVPDQRTDGTRQELAGSTKVAPVAAAVRAPPSPASAAAPPAVGAAAASAPEGERLDNLRQALQARVNALTTGSVGAPQAVAPAPEPHSVSFDFQSGIKTTLFSDGTIIREPFDVAALKSLAAPLREGSGQR